MGKVIPDLSEYVLAIELWGLRIRVKDFVSIVIYPRE
jgi:hypothetical protein